jgi:potassium-transporting ATPase KdpC subunit
MSYRKSVFLGALRASLVTWVLCGLFYPLALTGLGQLFFPFEANGSLDTAPDGTVIGSALIGQAWKGPAWFHSRPSATTDTDPNDPAKSVPAPYNAANSSGSNLGPTAKALQDRLAEDRKALEAEQPELAGRMLPADMITASASGLDPDITPANAALQVARVAHARRVPAERIAELVKRHVTGRALGIFGEQRVNVLELNLDLDKTFPAILHR